EDETNDESKEFDEEEYEELYGDVNINLIDAEPTDEEKGDQEMTNTETVDAKHENVNQEDVGNLVQDDPQATQKTEVLIPSSFISSDYAAKYLNFENIPPLDTEVVSMLDINVQHEVPRTSPLLTIPVSLIPKHTVDNPPEIVTTASSTTISSLLVTDLEKDVKELKTVDHYAAHLSTIKSEVLNAVKEYLGTSLDDALYKVLKKHDADIIKEHSVTAEIVERLRQQYVPEKSTEDIRKIKMDHARKQQVPKATITSSDTTALEEFDQKTTLFETMTKSKSFNKSLKRKTSKDTRPSKKVTSTESSKGTSKSQPKSTSKSAQAEETVFEAGDTQEPHNQGQNMGNTNDQPNAKASLKHDWFKNPERPLTPDPDWITRKTIDFRPPQFYVELEYNFKECYKSVTDHLDWNNLEGKEYPFDLSKPLPLIMERGRQVVPADFFFNNDLEYRMGGSSSKKYMTSITKTKTAKYDIPAIEDMVPSL
ncbi:hypothetical protein Tco_1277178, partial [Tanacetum coccineum]